MDPPTHGLLGAVIGQAFFARTLGRRALGWGAFLNMLPDVDVALIPALGGLAEWRYHRTATHGLAVLALLGVAAGWALVHWFTGNPVFDMEGFVVVPLVGLRTFLVPVLLVLGATIAAGVLPAWRASRVEPARVLRGVE